MEKFKLCAFADEYSDYLDKQIEGLKEFNIPYGVLDSRRAKYGLSKRYKLPLNKDKFFDFFHKKIPAVPDM